MAYRGVPKKEQKNVQAGNEWFENFETLREEKRSGRRTVRISKEEHIKISDEDLREKPITEEEVVDNLPPPLPTDPESIPNELRALNSWVLLKMKPVRRKDGTLKWDKQPWNPKTGFALKWSQPGSTTTFDAAMRAANRFASNYCTHWRVAMVPGANDGVCVIDLDNCVHDGEISEEALSIVNDLDSWTELSPSGKGLHVWLYNVELSGIKKKNWINLGVELYHYGAVISVTGQKMEGFTQPLSTSRNNSSKMRKLIAEWNKIEGIREMDALVKSGLTIKDASAFEKELVEKMPNHFTGSIEKKSMWGQPSTNYNVICPWADKHTSGRDNASDIILLDDGRVVYKCFHHNCSHRNYADVAKMFGLPGLTMIDEMNEEVAIVRRGVKMGYLMEGVKTRKEKGIQPNWEFVDKTALVDWYSNQTIRLSTGKMISKFEIWMQSPDRRQYVDLTFDPACGDYGGKVFNTYKGLAVVPKKGDWSKLNYHYKHVICSGNEGHYKYLMAWIARVIQEPGGDRPGIVWAMRGGQGVGKGLAVKPLTKIFGDHAVSTADGQKMVGRFNNLLDGCVLFFADEAFFAGDHSKRGMLKSLITEDTVGIEYKYFDTVQSRNYANIVMSTNNDWCIPAEEGERRYFVLDVPDTYKGNFEYFNALVNEMNRGGVEAFLYDMLRHNYSDVDLRDVPKTDALNEQKLWTKGHFERMVADWYDDGILDYELDGGPMLEWHENEELEAPKSLILSIYQNNHQRSRTREPMMGKTILMRQLAKLIPGFKEDRKRVGNSRDTVCIFPPRLEAFKAFQERVK